MPRPRSRSRTSRLERKFGTGHCVPRPGDASPCAIWRRLFTTYTTQHRLPNLQVNGITGRTPTKGCVVNGEPNQLCAKAPKATTTHRRTRAVLCGGQPWETRVQLCEEPQSPAGISLEASQPGRTIIRYGLAPVFVHSTNHRPTHPRRPGGRYRRRPSRSDGGVLARQARTVSHHRTRG